MSPLRIIIIVILIYLAYRLITGGSKKKPPVEKGRKKQPRREMPVSDVLEEDPVCKKLVPRQQAVEYEYQGKTIYFCSKKCRNTFRTKQGEHK